MSTMLRRNYPDLVLENALPALEFIVQDEFLSFEPKYEKIFNVRDMKTAIAQSTQISSLLPAGAVGEAEQVPLQKIVEGYAKTYTAVKYGIMLASSQELIDDLEYDVMGQNAKKLMKAFMSSVEISAASILNTGLSAAGPDGQPLFSASHPLLAPGAGTSSNVLTVPADLSMTSFKAMTTVLRKTLDTAGNKVMIQPKYLIVPPEQEYLAHELCKSVMLPDPNNASVNSVNSVLARYNIEPVVWDYLTSSSSVFVSGEKQDHQLTFYWRKRPAISTEYDFKTEVALTKLTGRFVAGYSDWRGIVSNGE